MADLNADDWPDIVVLNQASAWLVGQPKGRIIRVYWGGKDGFLLSQRQDLGVPGARALAAGDFDADGARDVAVLAGETGIRLFWAKESETTPVSMDTSVVPLPEEDLTCLTAADVNGDGQIDLVAGRPGGNLHILPGKAGRSWDKPIDLPGLGASSVAAGDLDSDGHADLVLTSLQTGRAGGGEQGSATERGVVRVLWGSEEGFSSASESIVLAVDNASASAIGDLDSDGRPDLAVAVFQGETTFEGESLVFFNAGDRTFQRAAQGIRTWGAAAVAVAPARGELPARAIFCNSLNGALDEHVPVDVYWGGPEGFDTRRHWEIPFTAGYEASASDLNADGYVDMVLMNSGHGGQLNDPTLGASIFWGSAKGFDLKNKRTVLRQAGSFAASNVADLNRDGYLDLVLGSFDAEAELVIYYGSSEGLAGSRRVALECPGRSMGCVIGDYNRDGWLDIACTSFLKDCVRVFWGSAEGFAVDRQTRLAVHAPIPAEAADLNADGWLDLIVGSYYDKIALYHDTGTTIFWGGPKGFTPWATQWLPGMSPVGLTVADFDADGYLDCFSPNYHGTAMREAIASYLYWGGPDGLRRSRRTTLICDSAHDAMAGDFDRDGLLDLAVSCHTKHGDHHTDSKVFYNDGQRFANPRVTRLPTHGTHWIYVQDVGHIYHRRWEQTYESSVFQWHQPAGRGRLSFKADLPRGTSLVFTARAAVNKHQLDRKPWTKVRSGGFALEAADRCLQYRATLKSDNGDRYPVLDRIRIALMP